LAREADRLPRRIGRLDAGLEPSAEVGAVDRRNGPGDEFRIGRRCPRAGQLGRAVERVAAATVGQVEVIGAVGRTRSIAVARHALQTNAGSRAANRYSWTPHSNSPLISTYMGVRPPAH